MDALIQALSYPNLSEQDAMLLDEALNLVIANLRRTRNQTENIGEKQVKRHLR